MTCREGSTTAAACCSTLSFVRPRSQYPGVWVLTATKHIRGRAVDTGAVLRSWLQRSVRPDGMTIWRCKWLWPRRSDGNERVFKDSSVHSVLVRCVSFATENKSSALISSESLWRAHCPSLCGCQRRGRQRRTERRREVAHRPVQRRRVVFMHAQVVVVLSCHLQRCSVKAVVSRVAVHAELTKSTTLLNRHSRRP